MSETQRNIGNPGQAQAIADAAKEDKQERQTEALEAESTLQKISQRRSEKTIHSRIEGSRVPFKQLKGAADEVEDFFLDLAGVDEDELTDTEKEQYREGRERIIEILDEKCEDPASTEDFWRTEFSNEERMEILNDLAEGGIEGNRQQN